jgi:hypothetical protein
MASISDMLDAKFGDSSATSDMLDAKLDAKLGLGDGKSVNLSQMERQLYNLTSSVVVPDAALRGLVNNAVESMGSTPSQDAAVYTGEDLHQEGRRRVA